MNLCKKKNKNFDAFSLIELIVVVVLIGIVSGIGLPSIAAWNNERETQSDATRLSTFFNSAYNASQQGTFEYLLIEIKSLLKKIPSTPLIDIKFLISSFFTSSFLVISNEPPLETVFPGKNFSEFGFGVVSVCTNIITI